MSHLSRLEGKVRRVRTVEDFANMARQFPHCPMDWMSAQPLCDDPLLQVEGFVAKVTLRDRLGDVSESLHLKWTAVVESVDDWIYSARERVGSYIMPYHPVRGCSYCPDFDECEE